MPALNPIMRFAFLLSGALFIYCLFHYGAQPMAVGLFASPIDKIAHAGVFGLIAMMLWFVFDRRYPLLIISLAVITGAADEIHQLFLPGRSADVSDWVADVSGACLPIIVLIASREKSNKGMGLLPNGGIKANSAGLHEEAGEAERARCG